MTGRVRATGRVRQSGATSASRRGSATCGNAGACQPAALPGGIGAGPPGPCWPQGATRTVNRRIAPAVSVAPAGPAGHPPMVLGDPTGGWAGGRVPLRTKSTHLPETGPSMSAMCRDAVSGWRCPVAVLAYTGRTAHGEAARPLVSPPRRAASAWTPQLGAAADPYRAADVGETERAPIDLPPRGDHDASSAAPCS